MCPTFLGRVQTRTAILVIPAIVGALLSLITSNEAYLLIIGLYYLIGVALDTTLYPLIIRWQPPWLTFVLGFGEFVLVYVAAQVLNVPLEPWQAVVWYWCAWVLAVWTGIVILPIVSLTWIESGGEFRRTGWSVNPENESVPVLAAATAQPVGPGGLLREFSSVHETPADVAAVPAPSGVHRQPAPQG
jgi:hypothetical protein